ncbi:unnamed protein product [Ectocarpus sp. CCAP 1310/34]|nr:unnamed protein product [Ectocarpus sp. CCAP 1310/34]CAB1115374.1 unnamed protein product [Ectocarpus sp. CCAP 1310/34]
MKAAAAAAARRKSLRTRGGETFVRLRNGGFSNSCGPICLLQHAMSDSLPIATIERATNGEIASEVRGALRYIRDITVDTSHGHTLSVLDPDEEREVHGFEDLVDSAERDILSKPMWDKIMRCPYGYFDGRAMMIGADALGLDGLLIVRVDSAGFLVAMDGMTTPVAEAKHLPLPSGFGGLKKSQPQLECHPHTPNPQSTFQNSEGVLVWRARHDPLRAPPFLAEGIHKCVRRGIHMTVCDQPEEGDKDQEKA